MDAARARKLGGRIAQIVAEMLERRIKDPRLGFITVTEARLTNDLREATVFYTVYGSAEERAGTAAALASAAGVIRSEIGRQTGLRHTPSVEFKPDTVPDNARNIEELVARARAAERPVRPMKPRPATPWPAGPRPTALRRARAGKMIISLKTRHPESTARDTRGRDSRAHAGPGRRRSGANPGRLARRRGAR